MYFFFNDTATTEIYTLSLHDASSDLSESAKKPFLRRLPSARRCWYCFRSFPYTGIHSGRPDRKSTRLNSSHEWISYAVFCLKKKKYRQTESRSHNPYHVSLTSSKALS